MNAAPSQRPHPLFSWLIPKELINMHESVISIGTKDRACTLALWRSIRNTKGLLRGKLSVSSALGWADACTHTSKKKKKGTLKAYITHTSHHTPKSAESMHLHTHTGRQKAHKASMYKPKGTDKACLYETPSLPEHTRTDKKTMFIICVTFFPLYPSVSSCFQSFPELSW